MGAEVATYRGCQMNFNRSCPTVFTKHGGVEFGITYQGPKVRSLELWKPTIFVVKPAAQSLSRLGVRTKMLFWLNGALE